MRDSIIVACDAGIVVCFLTTEELATDLVSVAEELIVLGAEVEIITDPDQRSEEFSQLLEDADSPGLFVVCRRREELDVCAIQRVFDRDSRARHRWLDLQVERDDVAASILRPVVQEVVDLQRVLEATYPIERIDPDEVSTVQELPGPPQEVATPEADEVDLALASLTAPCVTSLSELTPSPEPSSGPSVMATSISARGSSRTRRPKPWVFAAAGAMIGMALVLSSTVMSRDRGAEDPAEASQARITTAPTKVATVPALVPDAPSLAVDPDPMPDAMPDPMPDASPDSVSDSIRVAAQGPVEPTDGALSIPDSETEAREPVKSFRLDPLGRALVRGEVVAHEGVLARVVDGRRSWREAMTECKRRPFAGHWGWRVPNAKTVRELIRAGALRGLTVWSSTRADREGRFAYAVDEDQQTLRVAKEDDGSSTVCVLRRSSTEGGGR